MLSSSLFPLTLTLFDRFETAGMPSIVNLARHACETLNRVDVLPLPDDFKVPRRTASFSSSHVNHVDLWNLHGQYQMCMGFN